MRSDWAGGSGAVCRFGEECRGIVRWQIGNCELEVRYYRKDSAAVNRGGVWAGSVDVG